MSGEIQDTTPSDAFAKPSAEAYNKAHGRKAGAPTKGGPRQEAYDALLTGSKAPAQQKGWSADKASKTSTKSSPLGNLA